MSAGPLELEQLPDLTEWENTARQTALSNGMEILEGTNSDIFLDIDSTDGEKMFAQTFDRFCNIVEPSELRAWPSKSGNLHVHIILKTPMPFEEIIGWQIALGSDPARERWNWLKFTDGNMGFNCLFQPPQSSSYTAPIMLRCSTCGRLSALNKQDYGDQMRRPDNTWRCPRCHAFYCRVIEI